MNLSPAPHYQKVFYLEEQLGNNAFDYEKRSESHPSPQLRVAPLIALKSLSELSDNLRLTRETTFSAEDDGEIKSVAGLENFLLLEDIYRPKQKIFIFDNHNHAFYFWHLAHVQNPSYKLPATLVHIDQHKDSRIPGEILSKKDSLDMEKVFRYTNEILNVGNFIPPAFKTGMIDEMILVDSEATLDNFKMPASDKTILLDIDVDFFAPELDYIGNQKKMNLIRKLLPKADIVTIATSPFFIDQKLAIKLINEMLEAPWC